MSAISSFTDSQLFSYVKRYTNDEEWPKDPDLTFEVTKSFVTILEQNKPRLTITYLPLLEKIVEKEALRQYPIYKTRALDTYKAKIGQYVPATISAATFMQLKIAEEFVIAFRASEGSAFHIELLAQNILQLAKKENTQKGELLLSYFLETATPDAQKNFFLHFNMSNFETVRSLFFEKNYPRVKSLCFANNSPISYGDVQDIAGHMHWEIFCAELIRSCSAIETLKIDIEQKGELPADLANAMRECSELKHIDISNFYISRNRKTALQFLSKLPKLKTLSLQIGFTPELMTLPQKFYPKLRALLLRHEHETKPVPESPEDDNKEFLASCPRGDETTVQNLLNKCTQLTALRLTCELQLPSSIDTKRLELVLPIAANLPESARDPIEELFLYPCSQNAFRASDVKEIVSKFSNLSFLHVSRFPPLEGQIELDGKSWFDILREKKSLKQLSMQVTCHTKYLTELPSLCSRLSSLHLRLIESVDVDDVQKVAINSSSSLSRLTIECEISQSPDFQKHIAPFLAATNPEELVLIGFPLSSTITVSFTKIAIDGHLELLINNTKLSLKEFTRLKKLIICDKEEDSTWVFSKTLKPYVYKTFEVGNQLPAYAIDLELLK